MKRVFFLVVGVAWLAGSAEVAGSTELAPSRVIQPKPGDLYVSVMGGDDSSPGSGSAPFKTIQKGVDMARPGKTVWVMAGTYRECVKIVGRKATVEKPIRICGWNGETAIVSGTDEITVPPKKEKSGNYFVKVPSSLFAAFEASQEWDRRNVAEWEKAPPVAEPVPKQFFVDGTLMQIARWPNAPEADWKVRSSWAMSDLGSTRGTMVSQKLADSGIDAAGAYAVLNISHQFYTWTRKVLSHRAGESSFTYPEDMKGVDPVTESSKNNPYSSYEDDYFILFGTPALLDVAGEWILPENTDTLSFIPPKGNDMRTPGLELKVRNYGFVIKDSSFVELRDLSLFAASFHIGTSDHITLDGMDSRYYSSGQIYRMGDTEMRDMLQGENLVDGNDNSIRNCSLYHSTMGGILIHGERNLVENCYIHELNQGGSSEYSGVTVSPFKSSQGVYEQPGVAGNTVRFTTVHTVGNSAIHMHRGVTEYCHLYNGALTSMDNQLLRTSGPQARGTTFRYNWVHGCQVYTFKSEHTHGGLCIRGDDYTRGLLVHHNVCWDAGLAGFNIKGMHNRVYNNTVFDIGLHREDGVGNYIEVQDTPEKTKDGKLARTLQGEDYENAMKYSKNHDSLVWNNASLNITGNHKKTPFKYTDHIENHFYGGGTEMKLVDIGKMDFRPAAGSPLIDKGRKIEGITDDIHGQAPDIGAYEYGAARWIPGYRNQLWFLKDSDGHVYVRLRMEPVEPVTLDIATGGKKTEISFNRKNWQTMQRIPAAGPVACSIADLGLKETFSVDDIPCPGGKMVLFRTVK